MSDFEQYLNTYTPYFNMEQKLNHNFNNCKLLHDNLYNFVNQHFSCIYNNHNYYTNKFNEIDSRLNSLNTRLLQNSIQNSPPLLLFKKHLSENIQTDIQDKKDKIINEEKNEDDKSFEYSKEDEFEEITFKFDTLSDLIDIGNYYNNLKLNEDFIEENLEDKSICSINGKTYPINLKLFADMQPALLKLNEMIGLNDIKQNIIDLVVFNVQKIKSKQGLLHTIIEGPPGVGKTELGKIIAEVYANLGVIKSNKVKFVKRTDLIGKFVGQSAHMTQEAIDDADGGVLFIDEAYSLGAPGNEEGSVSYSAECINTLNQNLTENRNKFVCIIAGYKDQLERNFFSFNPGLKRRFPFKFTIDKYTAEELKDIFLMMIDQNEWTVDYDTTLINLFEDNKESFKYFGGDVELLFQACQITHAKRIFGKHPSLRKNLIMSDIQGGFEFFLKDKKQTNHMLYNMYL